MYKQIADFAAHAGLLYGICDAAPLAPETADPGRLAAPFASRNLQKRLDPAQHLPGVKSIIAVGLPIANIIANREGVRENPPVSSENGGFFSALACVPDYHNTLRGLLEELASDLYPAESVQPTAPVQPVTGCNRLKTSNPETVAKCLAERRDTACRVRELPRLRSDMARHVPTNQQPLNYRITVDSAGLMERAFARRAGLGFVGRNGMLISEKYGSYFNIGLLLVDVSTGIPSAAEGGSPYTAECQNCNRCVQACPTGALAQNNFFRCLSYLTQKKGAASDFTAEERAWLKSGKQLYGCDICQNVCPHNSHITHTPTPISRLTPRDILDMTEPEFDEIFGSTAVSRRGFGVLRRNAEIIRPLLKPKFPLKISVDDQSAENVKKQR